MYIFYDITVNRTHQLIGQSTFQATIMDKSS